MQTGNNLSYFQKHHLSSDGIIQDLFDKGWSHSPTSVSAGPAQRYTHADYAGSIGITPHLASVGG